MKGKLLSGLLFVLFVLLLQTQVIADDRSDYPVIGANVRELLQWADRHNPDISAMSDEIEAAQERILPVGALPDPILRAELRSFAGPGANDGFNPIPGKGNGTKYTLMQNIPLWGKRDLRKQIATEEVKQVKGSRQSILADIHARIKIAYAHYYQTVGLKKLNEDILSLLADLESVAQVRYSNGLVPQQDVIRAQIEKTAIRSEIISLQGKQYSAIAKLNAVINRPQQSPIAEPSSLRHVHASKLDATILRERLFQTNPQLLTQSARIGAAEANRRLIEKNRYPDITLGISPIQRGGRIDSWDAMVEIRIPIQVDTRRAQENEAGAMLSAEKNRQQAVANQLLGELMQNLAAYEAAEQQKQLIINTLLPQAELTFRSALAGYEAGTVDFATLIDAQQTIKRARQDKLKAEVNQELMITEIEKIIGEEL